MGKWLIGFVTVEFVFLLAWIMGVDHNQRRRERAREKEQEREWLRRRLGNDGDPAAWRQVDDGGQYQSILVAELEATAEILTAGIERLKTEADVSLAGLREFRDGLAAQVFAMRNCRLVEGRVENRRPAHWQESNGGVWMLDKGEAPR